MAGVRGEVQRRGALVIFPIDIDVGAAVQKQYLQCARKLLLDMCVCCVVRFAKMGDTICAVCEAVCTMTSVCPMTAAL